MFSTSYITASHQRLVLSIYMLHQHCYRLPLLVKVRLAITARVDGSVVLAVCNATDKLSLFFTDSIFDVYYGCICSLKQSRRCIQYVLRLCVLNSCNQLVMNKCPTMGAAPRQHLQFVVNYVQFLTSEIKGLNYNKASKQA